MNHEAEVGVANGLGGSLDTLGLARPVGGLALGLFPCLCARARVGMGVPGHAEFYSFFSQIAMGLWKKRVSTNFFSRKLLMAIFCIKRLTVIKLVIWGFMQICKIKPQRSFRQLVGFL